MYRDKKEIEEWKKKDPIPHYKDYLLQEKIITKVEIDAFEKKIETKIQKAVDFAEAGTWESIDQLTRFVYSETVT